MAGGALLDLGAGDGSVTKQLLALGFDRSKSVTTEVSQPMVARLRSLGVRAVQTELPSQDEFPRGGCFDVVAMLNLLDRCDDPSGMLLAAKRLVRPQTHLPYHRGLAGVDRLGTSEAPRIVPSDDLSPALDSLDRGHAQDSASGDLGSKHECGPGHAGLILVAVVLPFRPFVEDGAARRPPRLPLQVGRANDPRLSQEAMAAEFQEHVLAKAGLRTLVYSRVPYLCEGDGLVDFYTLPDTLFVCESV